MGTVEGKKQEKRRALLEAAYDLFLERGAAKTLSLIHISEPTRH